MLLLIIMHIMVTRYGFQVTGVVDGLTMAGEESGIGDIGHTAVKGNILLAPRISL
jgi:hypothetical protein